MKKIAMILHTNGLEYDDRIRKEMLTLKQLYPDVYFKIFAIIDNKHDICEDGITDYGVDYTIPILKSRLKYKPATHLVAKAWDFYRTVSPQLKDFDAIWCADFDVVFFILLSNKRIVWDMHELPEIFMGSIWRKLILKYLMKRCKIIIHANENRLNYLRTNNAISNVENHLIIRNFPNFNDKAQETDDTLNTFKMWKGDATCIYLQGLNDRSRSAIEAVTAVMNTKGCKGVVVGKFKDDCKQELYNKYGENLNARIFFTGMVPQQITPHYIKECTASLILYKNTSPNNYYCEPNRMFQSIVNDCPVVVGCNPPMRDLVEQYGFGVVLKDDGRDPVIISKALDYVIENIDPIKENILRNKTCILWEQQIPVFHNIMKTLFRY